MRLLLSFLLFILAFQVVTLAQDTIRIDNTNLDPYEAEYQKRIKKERIFGVYIPKDITDCFIELNKKINTDSKEKFRIHSEEEASTKLHFSLGRWMIHNWSFYEGSRLSVYMNSLGISYPDDMARFIIITYHRYLNKKPLKVKELATFYKEKVEKENEERMKKAKIIHEETRKRQN